jgi:hypothetical protein
LHLPNLVKEWFSLFIIIAFALDMLFSPLAHNSWHEKAIVTILLALGFGLTGLSYWNRTPERRTQREERKLRQMRLSALRDERGQNEDNRPAVIFGGIYTIVNGLGIVQILQDYVKTINDNLATFSARTFTSILGIGQMETLRLFDFFMTQIPFLHGAILALSSDTSEIGYYPKLNQYLPISIFVALLVHAALFYFIGSNLSNFPLFIFFLWVLFVFNAVWLSVLRQLVEKELVIPEWIQLNSITAAFLFTYFFYPYFIDSNYTVTDDYSSNLILLFVLGFRTFFDYSFGWKDFYSQLRPKNFVS